VGANPDPLVYTVSMRIRQPGFTLIELIISTALVVILLSVAVPRYSTYSRTQDMASSLGDLAGCIQKAQAAAAAPAESGQGSPAYTQAEITYNTDSEATICTVYSYTKDAKFGTDGNWDSVASPTGSQSQIGDPVPALNVVPCAVLTSLPGTYIDLPQTVRLRFGVLEGGVPRELFADTRFGAIDYPSTFGSGFTINLALVPAIDTNQTVSCASHAGARVLFMGRLGLPVVIQ
jgi:prepilin-type N-terminal cleavage/methylation domain-containing protein